MKIKSVIGFNLSSQNLDVIAAWRLIKMRAADVKKVLRACLKKGGAGDPPAPVGDLADRNGASGAQNQRVLMGRWRPLRSVRRVAGRHRPVACATHPRIFRQALRSLQVSWPSGSLLGELKRFHTN